MKSLSAFFVRFATLGPLGGFKAPGTWGSAAGVGFYCVVFHGFNSEVRWRTFFWLTLFCCALAVAVCHFAEAALKKKDPGEIILDEFVAMPLVFCGFGSALRAASHAWAWYLAGFFLFRFFDIAKPFGVREIQRIGGGAGVVADDLLAAAYACASLHGLHAAVFWLR